MKKQSSRLVSFALALFMLVGMIQVVIPNVQAATANQLNMVDRADYLYNATWVCQQTVEGWGGTFYAGNTYHIPYGQPINSGEYVGFAATVEEYLQAAATAGSIFYTGRSYYTGTSAPYYSTDCSAFVSWCWGISRTTTYYIPSVSTKIGAVDINNCTYNLQLGDALNSAEHVVMVTDLIYDGNGAITQIEITEQTPPQLKRSYYTPADLVNKYGSEYTVYRYYGNVLAAPSARTADGWQSIDGNWYYYLNNEKKTGWIQEGENWYYLNSDGVMQTGWVAVGDKWYFMDTSGVMQTGWIQEAGEWYYLDLDTGAMRTGWLLDRGVWYYLNPANGIMQTGWVAVSGKWYYMNELGAMQYGWVIDNDKWYYLRTDGSMVTGQHIIKGVAHQFDNSGVWIPSNYDAGMPGSGNIVAHGLDVSAWQESGLDFQNFANAGYDFVILRCGTSKGKDVLFEEYYQSAKAAGLGVGCYFYSYATSVAEAQQEARDVLSYIYGKQFEYPIYFDFEDPTQMGLDDDLSAQICRGFLDVIYYSGYVAGIYSYSWLLERSWVSSYGITSGYEGWVARVYSEDNNTGITSGEYNRYKDLYCSVYGMHQYSFTTYVNGAGPFDADVAYKDYPSIMKQYGLNGYPKPQNAVCNHDSHDIYGNCLMCDQYVGHCYSAEHCTICGVMCNHSYSNGFCTACGKEAPVYAPEVTAKSFTLSFEDEILVNFYYTISDTRHVTEQGMLVFDTDPGTADVAAASKVYPNALYDEVKGLYMNTTDGIAAKELGDTRYYAAYAKLSDGEYAYSGVYSYSPRKYALNMLGKVSASEKLKALCVAMLNYGTEAQIYFDYRTDDLMNASLTADQKARIKPYSSDMLNGAVAANSSKIGSFQKTDSGFIKKSATVSFDSAFSINFYFSAQYPPEGEMNFYYWTASDFASLDMLTKANATGKRVMELAEDGSYWAVVDGIAAKSIDDTVYVAGVYTANGETYCTGIVAYSLSTYCKKTAAGTGDMKNLAAATGVYGYYAKAYFM